MNMSLLLCHVVSEAMPCFDCT